MRRQLAVVTVLFLLACQDSSTGPDRFKGGPANAIVDARHQGNSHFFWLEPQTRLSAFDKSLDGKLNMSLSPEVRICRSNGTICIGPDVAVLSRGAGTVKDQIYWFEAFWPAYPVKPQLGEFYQARVHLGNVEIGLIDIKFVTIEEFNATDFNSVDYAPQFWDPKRFGGNMPGGGTKFRFRLEDGVLREALGLDGECTDCTEASVPANPTQTVVIETPNDDAAAVFEPGSVSQTINVLVEKLDVPCLPTDAQQYPACYRFVAEPDIEFTIPATVEVCIEEVDNFADGQIQLYKVKEQRVEGAWVPTGPVEPLENVPDQFISCGDPVIIGAIGRKFPRLAQGLRAVTRPLARVFGPRSAYADDEGRGGRASEFSRVGWTRAVNIAKGSGDGQTGTTGAALEPVSVHLTPVHFDHQDEGTPSAAFVPVRYQLIAPGNVAGPLTNTLSNLDGNVSIPVALGAAAGTYRLVVTAPGTNMADRNPESGELTPRPVPVAEFTFTATSTFQISNGRVLLYHAEDPTGAASFRSRLISTGVFTADQIDVRAMTTTPEPLTSLSAYGCVLAWTDIAPPNPAGIGDRLQEYVDAGGKVVLAVYALGVPSRPWELQGGIMGAAYNPLVLTENQVNTSAHSLDFSTALTDHPILQGVTAFSYSTNTNYSEVTLRPGATLVASDNHNVPLIAVSTSGRVVGINVWPLFPNHGGAPTTAQIDRTFANACR